MRIALVVIVALTHFITGCVSKKIQNFTFKDSQWLNIDYADIRNWAAHPAKKDESDTLINYETKKQHTSVDVFYVHPTTLTGKIKNGYTIATLDDEVLNLKTDQTAIRFQASVYNLGDNVYAPRYRQAHIQVYQESDTLKRKLIFEMAYKDVKAAFDYYLKNYNKGKPFIIASHSQGTTHAKRLIRECVDGTTLKDQLVVAYLIGMPVLKQEFREIPVCVDSLKINCFVSWRTFRQDYQDTWANRIDTTIAVVNPVTWQTNDEIAGRKLHKGAVLYNMNKVYSGIQETQAQGNGLWISKPKFPGSIFYWSKNYHIGDINLFYIDIKENMISRIKAYEEHYGLLK